MDLADGGNLGIEKKRAFVRFFSVNPWESIPPFIEAIISLSRFGGSRILSFVSVTATADDDDDDNDDAKDDND